MISAFCVGAGVAGVGDGFWLIMAGAGLLLALGLVDDLRDTDYRVRLLVQGLASLFLVIGADVRIESLGNLLGFGTIDLGLLAVPFSVFAVVGMINAVNMIDGLDGLAGGISLIILSSVATFAIMTGSALMFPALILAASVLGFLLLNYRFPWRRKASVFMGDAGSYFLGYCIAWFVIALPNDASQTIAPIHALWIAGFPVTDTLTTMWRRRRQRLSMFHASHDHAHHLLRHAGFSVDATVLLMVLMTAAYAFVGLGNALNHQLPETALSYLFVVSLVVYSLLLRSILPLTKPFRHYLADDKVTTPTDG